MADSLLPIKSRIKRACLWGILAIVVINGFSWTPGYGGRRDGPGAEVERYFGWPACFYADLWRTEQQINLLNFNHWDYAPPVPITSQMHFVYSHFGILPLILNILFVAAGTGILFVVKEAERTGELSTNQLAVGGGLVIAAWLIFRFAGHASVYL